MPTYAVNNVVSYYGPLSVHVNSHLMEGYIEATVRCNTDKKPGIVRIRLPHPEGKKPIKVEGGSYNDISETRGMAVKLKDYATYGNINDETYSLLVEKRGKKDKEGKIKNIFRLNPPRGGFERKGIKQPFSANSLTIFCEEYP